MLIRNGHNIDFWKRRWLSSFRGLLAFVSNSFAIHCLLCIMDRIFEWKPVTFWLGGLYGYLHCWNSHEFMPHYWWAFLSPYSGYIAHCESLRTVVNLSHVFRFYSLFSRSFASGNFLQKLFWLLTHTSPKPCPFTMAALNLPSKPNHDANVNAQDHLFQLHKPTSVSTPDPNAVPAAPQAETNKAHPAVVLA